MKGVKGVGRVSNKAAGLTRAPSGYALYTGWLATQPGVTPAKPTQRLRKKTLCKGLNSAKAKWMLVQ